MVTSVLLICIRHEHSTYIGLGLSGDLGAILPSFGTQIGLRQELAFNLVAQAKIVSELAHAGTLQKGRQLVNTCMGTQLLNMVFGIALL